MEEPGSRINSTFYPSYGERLGAEWFLLVHAPINLLAALAFPAAGVWLAWLLLSHPESTSGGAWFLVLLAFGFSPAMFFWNSYRAHRVALAQGAFNYAFDSEGVHVSTPLAQSFHRWPAVLRIRASRNLLLVYFSKRCAHFVPIRALPGNGAVDVVRQLAKAGGVPRVDP
ncbi:MAG TPA: YcxB family protein [Stenotrophomonas sp.]|nr:YcxB family protein [Stenotrophomonas sp.]